MAKVISPIPEPKNALLEAIGSFLRAKRSQLASTWNVPTPTPTPTPIPQPTRQDYIGAIQAIIPAISSQRLPLTNYATKIYDTTSQYPIFKKYPFLPVAQLILESSGMQKYNEPKNVLGWGAEVSSYHPQTIEQVLADYASAVGGRNLTQEQANYPNEWQARMSTAARYQPFRETGNLVDYANIFAPPQANPGTGGQVYANRAQWIMDLYNQELQKILAQKGNL